jgi:hypothetical protein
MVLHLSAKGKDILDKQSNLKMPAETDLRAVVMIDCS